MAQQPEMNANSHLYIEMLQSFVALRPGYNDLNKGDLTYVSKHEAARLVKAGAAKYFAGEIQTDASGNTYAVPYVQESGIPYDGPVVMSSQPGLEYEAAELREKVKALEAELAAIKAEKAKKPTPAPKKEVTKKPAKDNKTVVVAPNGEPLLSLPDSELGL